MSVDGPKLQAKIYKGYGQAAKRIGYPYQQFRATSSSNPLGTEPLQTLPASFTTNFNYSAPNKYGQATWLGLFDARLFTPGDFLVGHQGTYFIAAMQDTLPIYCVQANRVISVLRGSMEAGVGQVGYGGAAGENEVMIMSGWPASILQGTKGERNEVNLPSDAKTPWFSILFPIYGDLILRTSDIITDDIDRRYVISSAELTDMGWRVTAMQVMV